MIKINPPIIPEKVSIMKTRPQSRIAGRIIMALSLLTLGFQSGHCRLLPEELKQNDLVFIYVHGFGEARDTLAFTQKMSAFLKPLPLKAAAVTYRWDRTRINPARVVFQWTQAKHVHKGGLIQRDYANLAPAIGYLTLLREKMFVAGAPPMVNLAWRVGGGSVHRNDIARFETRPHPILIQQNVNTGLYRAVALSEKGARTRQAWGANPHEILKKQGLFEGPYERILSTKAEKKKAKSAAS